MKNLKKALSDVFGENGYYFDKLSHQDLFKIREIVRTHYDNVLSKLNRDEFKEIEINRYHEFSHLIEHEKVWSKTSRILPLHLLEELMKCNLFENIKNELGEIFISDEDNIGRAEVYWRLVRPLPHNDVGPLHADGWFWDVEDTYMPDTHLRVKFWISLYNETNKSGFRYIPKSHNENFAYSKEFRDYKYKPVFEMDEANLNIVTFNSNPGDLIVFHDRLIHGGKSGGSLTRVSIEFTLFIPKEYLKKEGIL